MDAKDRMDSLWEELKQFNLNHIEDYQTANRVYRSRFDQIWHLACRAQKEVIQLKKNTVDRMVLSSVIDGFELACRKVNMVLGAALEGEDLELAAGMAKDLIEQALKDLEAARNRMSEDEAPEEQRDYTLPPVPCRLA